MPGRLRSRSGGTGSTAAVESTLTFETVFMPFGVEISGALGPAQISNGWHGVRLGPRRYRAPRPAVARANIDCPCKYAQGVAGLDCDGDHDEGSCSKHGGNRNAACDTVDEMLAALLLTAGFRDVRYR